MLLKLNFLQLDLTLYLFPGRTVMKLSTIGGNGLVPSSQAKLKRAHGFEHVWNGKALLRYNAVYRCLYNRHIPQQ